MSSSGGRAWRRRSHFPTDSACPWRWQSPEQEAVAIQLGVKVLYPPGPILMMPDGAGTIIPFYRRKTEPWSITRLAT